MFGLKNIKQNATKTKFEDSAKNPTSDYLEVNNWEISEFICSILVPIAGVHPFPVGELQLITAATCYFKPKAIFEWGTHIGKSARIFYEIAKAFDIDAVVHSVDLPDELEHVEHPGETRGSMVKGLEGVKLYQGDGVNKSISLCKEMNLKGSEVLFFVDGDHSYESVTRELMEIYSNYPDAAILLHDTFLQSEDSKYNIGPYNAVSEFLEKHTEYKSIKTETGLPGMTLIYKK